LVIKRSWSLVQALMKEFSWFVTSNQAARRHSKVGPLHLWQRKRQFQIKFLRQAGLQPDHFLLDVGCGTLRGGIPLIDYLQAGHYYGIESRPSVLDEARAELREANLEEKRPVLQVVTELGAVDLGVQFDVIWAYAVLIHMHDEVANECFALVQKHLADDGSFYANVCIGAPREAALKWQGFPVVWRPLRFYQELSGQYGLSCTDLGSLKSLNDVSGLKSIDEQRMLRFRKHNGTD
jgi:SAM-dependent methyltransferase